MWFFLNNSYLGNSERDMWLIYLMWRFSIRCILKSTGNRLKWPVVVAVRIPIVNHSSGFFARLTTHKIQTNEGCDRLLWVSMQLLVCATPAAVAAGESEGSALTWILRVLQHLLQKKCSGNTMSTSIPTTTWKLHKALKYTAVLFVV